MQTNKINKRQQIEILEVAIIYIVNMYAVCVCKNVQLNKLVGY